MRKNICFIHSYGVNHYRNILEEYASSGNEFFDACDKIFVLYGGESPTKLHNKFEILNINPPDEISSMNFIYDFCQLNTDANICYIHTKGVTKDNECITDWRKYMFYFCCQRFKDRIQDMEKHDTCGTDLRCSPCLHYSGNFWWARSEYISNLCHPSQTFSPLTERHKSEFWICSNKEGRHLSLHDCGIGVYERHLHRYPPERYVK